MLCVSGRPDVTRAEATRRIRALAQSQSVATSVHFASRLARRGYTLPDAYRLLHTGTVQRKPEWSDRRRNFKVELEGRDTRGRRTRLVVSLRPHDAAIVLVTIHELR